MRRFLTLGLALTLAACSSTSTSGVPVGLTNAKPNVQSTPPASPQSTQLLPTSFVFGKITQPTAAMRRAQYITNSVTSVKIQLTAVNGTTPAANLVTSVTSALTPATCPCTIAGPSAPAGQDTFTLTTYDASNTAIATATAIATIAASQANSVGVTLNGIPANVTIVPPAGTAGTAFSSPQTVAVSVKDADNNVIAGAYATPVVLANSDTSSATSLTTSGPDSPSTLQLLSSSDMVTLAYTGLAIPSASISATIGGAAAGAGTFTPALQPIVLSAPVNGSTPQLTLTSLSTSTSMNASEVGWTNSPYNRALSVTVPPACTTVGSLAAGSNSTATGTPFAANAATTPTNGTCSATISDFAGGQTQNVALVYTSSSTNFAYTGSPQTLTVPFGVSLVHVVAAGAQGGAGASLGGSALGGPGGMGAIETADVPISAGTLTVTVGGRGSDGGTGTSGVAQLAGGYNGGGAAGAITCGASCGIDAQGGSGGGFTSIGQSSTMLIVAGGGGTNCPASAPIGGGAGGYPTGGSLPDPLVGCNAGTAIAGGGGGTQSAGGAGAMNFGGAYDGSAGSALQGGAGGSDVAGVGTSQSGAGGGGGYYGGGGGAARNSISIAGGGGGSSYIISTATNVTHAATNTGNGSATISW